jgi:hypothetical protein
MTAIGLCGLCTWGFATGAWKWSWFHRKGIPPERRLTGRYSNTSTSKGSILPGASIRRWGFFPRTNMSAAYPFRLNRVSVNWGEAQYISHTQCDSFTIACWVYSNLFDELADIPEIESAIFLSGYLGCIKRECQHLAEVKLDSGCFRFARP